ncbi:MAG TPA: hypothetical protein VGK58_07925 [Lacipirellulaceae bacterium]
MDPRRLPSLADVPRAVLIVIAGWITASTLGGTLWAQTPAVTWPGASTPQANGTVLQVPIDPKLTVTMPNGAVQPISRRSKLWLTVDTRWANNYGYRPIEVTVLSPKPLTADRQVTFRLYARWWTSTSGTFTVEQDFELPTGSTSATATLALPQYQLATQVFWWDVWIDGVKDRDLSLDEDVANNTMLGGLGASAGLSCLIVGQANNKRTLLTSGTLEFDFLSLPVASFPQRWIDYTCLDVVTLSHEESLLLSQANPGALEALRRWVHAGGLLWVTDIGSKLEQLGELSKLLGLDPALIEMTNDDNGQAEGGSDEASVKTGWRPRRFSRSNSQGQSVTFMNVNTGRSRVERDPVRIDRLRNDRNYVITEQRYEPIEERRARRRPADSARWFVEQRYGLGTVRAFREPIDVVFAGSAKLAQNVGAVTPYGGPVVMEGNISDFTVSSDGQDDDDSEPTALSLALRSAPRWEERHGMTPDAANADFAKLLVPGVGTAPVSEFQVLITLFVLVIGPANFWLLKRYRRLHLLVLTVPVAAIVTTVGLFAYAILSDGFGTKVRAHSFTTLDQRSGASASWSRLSYYSGFAPGDGLSVPSDVAMYPVVPGWNESGVDTSIGVSRELLWEPDEAKLTRGWLRSRTPTQYLAIRSGKSSRKLELLAARDKMRATNRLGADIQFVLTIGADQKLFVGENIASGGRTNLEPIARNDAIRRLRDLVVKNTPQAPEALADVESDFAETQRWQRQRNYGGRYGSAYGGERLGTNLAQGALAQLAGLEGTPALQLPPRSFVAVTRTGMDVPLGISGATELASFHVIVGRW